MRLLTAAAGIAAMLAGFSASAAAPGEFAGMWTNPWNHSLTITKDGDGFQIRTYSPQGATSYEECLVSATYNLDKMRLDPARQMKCTTFNYPDNGGDPQPAGTSMRDLDCYYTITGGQLVRHEMNCEQDCESAYDLN